MEIVLPQQSKAFPNRDSKYELSALLDADSFFYGLIDYGSQLEYVNSIKRFQDVSQEAWQNIVVLRKIKIGILNHAVSILPFESLAMEDLIEIVAHSAGILEPELYDFRVDRCEAQQLKICYAVPKSVLIGIRNQWQEPLIYHFVTTFVQGIELNGEDGLYIYASATTLVLCALKDHKLPFINCYQIKHPIDAFYYIMLTYREVFEEDVHVALHYASHPHTSNDILHHLQQYNPRLQHRTSDFKMDGQVLTDDYHYHALQCVSKI